MADPEYRSYSGPFYHYTSIDALLGIVTSRVLWATNVYFLNDATESRLGLEMFQASVMSALETSSGIEREFWDFVRPALTHRMEHESAVYVLCFSAQKDQLSQWRGYTPHGKGVCIGFSSGLLVDRMTAQEWEFQPCRYSSDSQLGYVEAVLQRMRREVLAEPLPKDRRRHFQEVFKNVLPDVLKVASFIKSAAFKEEQEWRFFSPPILASNSRVQFRVGHTTLIPQVDFELVANPHAQFPIDEIIVGPCPTSEESRAAIHALMRRYGSGAPPMIRNSSIPYRQL